MTGAAAWLRALDFPLLRRVMSRRAFELALSSELRYARPPALTDDGVTAVLVEGGRAAGGGSAEYRVVIDMPYGDSALLGDCSRCMSTFGPCVHMATLAVDLAASAPMREALLARRSAAQPSSRAPEVRFARALEQRFDAALHAWLAPAADGQKVEIAASPSTEGDAYVGRAYGDRGDPQRTRVVTIAVRRAGERKLLVAHEITQLADYGSRDRRVLSHAKERGTSRKAAFAVGVEASLAIEAMRLHGGVFAAGYRELLDFRATPVRPRIVVAAGEGDDAAAESLSLGWMTDAGGVPIAADEAVFFPGPFPYLWTSSGAIYPVARDVDVDLASHLAASPALLVPPGRLRDVGARLLRAVRGRGISIPRSEAFGLPPIETPRFVLRLAGEPLAIEGELVAIYPARTVPLFGPLAAGAASDDGRDLDGEERARAAAIRAGVVRRILPPPPFDGEEAEPEALPVHAGGAGGAGGDDAAPEGLAVAVSGERAIAFWQGGLLALRGSEDPPIDVALSERLARVRVGPPLAARVHVALEGDWLATRVEFSSQELPVELVAIRAALARKERWVALSDGTLSRISASIESLADEAAEVMGAGAEANLPAHQLGRIDRWIEENDGRIDASIASLRKRLRSLAVAEEPEMPSALNATLRPYQRRGLAWLQFLQVLGAGGILADDMGLGKTITALAYLLRRKEAEGPAPSLVVCPTSVATNWVREAARFTPGLSVLLLHGPSPGARARAAEKIEGSDLVVTTYGLLRRDKDLLASTKFRCAILDEAQNIKNADSDTKRAASRLDASMRLALSGTPIENRLRELWSIMSFVNPGILGTSRSFETRYERPITADRKSPLAAELRAVVRPFLLRRTKDDVLPELPPKTEIDRMVTLTHADKRMYDALAHTLRESIARAVEKKRDRDTSSLSLSVFTALTRLRQMACDPRLVDENLLADARALALPEGAPRAPKGQKAAAARLSAAPASARGAIGVRDRVMSAKREAFLELVRELVAEGRRALVFSQFVQLLTLWRRDLDAEGIAYEYLDGSTTKRDVVVARFQEGTAPLFLISLKAGGAGLNLTAADTVIHCDPWWNPAVEDQATDRAYRIGQDKPVTVVRLVARGTLEEKIVSLKAKKRELTGAVIGDDAGALAGLHEDDIRLLLGESDDDDLDDEDDDFATDDARGREREREEAEASAASATKRRAKTAELATDERVVDPEFHAVVREAQRWLAATGRMENDLADVVDIPAAYAARLAQGEPFPCSRAVGDRIRARLRAWT